MNFFYIYFAGCLLSAGIIYSASKKPHNQVTVMNAISYVALSWFFIGVCLGALADSVDEINDKD